MVHRRIYRQCVFVLVRLRVVVIFDQQPVVVLRTNNKTYGQRSFAVAEESVWNSLPLAAGDFDLTLPAFHKLLKIELFRRAYTASQNAPCDCLGSQLMRYTNMFNNNNNNNNKNNNKKNKNNNNNNNNNNDYNDNNNNSVRVIIASHFLK